MARVRHPNVLPIHGEWRHLRANAALAARTGVPADRIVLADDGVVVDLVDGVEGRVVVDGGSGFGMVSNLCAAWGASRVWSIEVHEPMVRSHRRINRAYFPEFADRVMPLRGDVSVLPLPDASVDVVMSIEAISHYYDVNRFLDECARVLRRSGAARVYVATVARVLKAEPERMEREAEGPDKSLARAAGV